MTECFIKFRHFVKQIRLGTAFAWPSWPFLAQVIFFPISFQVPRVIRDRFDGNESLMLKELKVLSW